jgi:hypothetical protein
MADTVTQDQVSDEDVYARVCIGCRKRLDPHEYTKEFFKCDSCLKPVEEDVAATKSLWGLGDLGNEQPAWPDEGYAEYCPASSHLSSYNRFREFTMGATGISEEDYETLECDEGEPVVMHTKVYLLTERLDDIRLYIRRRGNEERLVGLLVGSGDSRIPIGIASAREDVKGGIDEDGYDDDDPTRRVKPVQEDEGNLSFGKRRASLLKVEESPGTEMTDFPPDREESLELSDKSPYLKKITIQQTVWGKEREKLQKRIVYLCLEDMEGKTLSYGHKMRPKAEAGEIVYPPEVAEGVLAVVGVGMCDWHPLSLQVVDLSAASDPTSDDAGETVFYGGSRLNNVVITDDMDRYELGYTVAVENMAVLDMQDELTKAILTTAPSSAALVPSATPLLQECIQEDQATIASLFRMNRSLTHAIQEKVSVGEFPANNWRNMIPLKHMAASIATGLVPIKRAVLTQPGVNVYMYAMLTQQPLDIMKAVLVSVNQIFLMLLLSLGVDTSSFGEEYCSIAFSLIISFVVVATVTAQISQHNDCRSVFEFSYWPGNGVPFCVTLMVWLDFLANVAFAALVIILNFVLLMSTTEYLDLVLNSTATLFILEVDDIVMNVEAEEIQGLCLKRCFDTMTNIVMKVMDSRYWQGWLLLQHDTTARINSDNCAFVWPRQNKKKD